MLTRAVPRKFSCPVPCPRKSTANKKPDRNFTWTRLVIIRYYCNGPRNRFVTGNEKFRSTCGKREKKLPSSSELLYIHTRIVMPLLSLFFPQINHLFTRAYDMGSSSKTVVECSYGNGETLRRSESGFHHPRGTLNCTRFPENSNSYHLST